MLGGSRSNSKALSAFSLGMLEENKWVKSAESRVLDPRVLHQWAPPVSAGTPEVILARRRGGAGQCMCAVYSVSYSPVRNVLPVRFVSHTSTQTHTASGLLSSWDGTEWDPSTSVGCIHTFLATHTPATQVNTNKNKNVA